MPWRRAPGQRGEARAVLQERGRPPSGELRPRPAAVVRRGAPGAERGGSDAPGDVCSSYAVSAAVARRRGARHGDEGAAPVAQPTAVRGQRQLAVPHCTSPAPRARGQARSFGAALRRRDAAGARAHAFSAMQSRVPPPRVARRRHGAAFARTAFAARRGPCRASSGKPHLRRTAMVLLVAQQGLRRQLMRGCRPALRAPPPSLLRQPVVVRVRTESLGQVFQDMILAVNIPEHPGVFEGERHQNAGCQTDDFRLKP